MPVDDQAPTGWRFRVHERSAGVFEIEGSSSTGVNLTIVDTDPDRGLQRARDVAISADLKR